MRVSVIVPSYRRPNDLRRCLDALVRQSTPPFEILVVHRADDEATIKVGLDFNARMPCASKAMDAADIADWAMVRLEAVGEAGQVAALNQGLEVARGDVVAFVDDDAVPHASWVERIACHFEVDPELAGVGGRDIIGGDSAGTVLKRDIGRIQWFGRPIGNHHLGQGLPREVDLLKGANMSFRRDRLGGVRFDSRLKGKGAQVANDWALSLCLRARGERLIYDPAVAVDHFPAERHDDDRRDGFSCEAQHNAAHNVTLVLLEYLPGWRRPAFMLWSLAIGSQAFPGLLQSVRLLLMGRSHVGTRLRSTVTGLFDGVRTWKRGAGIRASEHRRRPLPEQSRMTSSSAPHGADRRTMR